jgi:hypothetical protein
MNDGNDDDDINNNNNNNNNNSNNNPKYLDFEVLTKNMSSKNEMFCARLL